MFFASTAEAREEAGEGLTTLAPVLIVGLGNPILGDDGIGWKVAQAVEAVRPDLPVTCVALGGLSLMEALIGYRRVIIVDAIQTTDGAIGDVDAFPLEALPSLSAGHTTAIHDTSLQDAVLLGKQMGAALPDEIWIVGVEAERIWDFSEELSPAVDAAIPAATQAVLDKLNQWGVPQLGGQ